MRIWAFKRVAEHPGVSVYRAVERRLGLGTVLKCGLYGASDDCGGLSLENANFRPSRISIRAGQAGGFGEAFWGFVAYTDVRAARLFLAEGIRFEDEEDAKGVCSRPGDVIGLLRHVMLPAQPKSWESPACFASWSELEGKAAPSADRKWLHVIDPLRPHSVCAEIQESYAGFRIPREVWISRPRKQGGEYTWYDGRSFGTAPSLDEVPTDLLRTLEADGTPCILSDPWALSAPPYRPIFLVRIPELVEALAVQRAHPAGLLPVSRKEPCYLLRSREPLALPEGLPVITDPVEALAILQRSPGGVFQSGELEWTSEERTPIRAGGGWRVGALLGRSA